MWFYVLAPFHVMHACGKTPSEESHLGFQPIERPSLRVATDIHRHFEYSTLSYNTVFVHACMMHYTIPTCMHYSAPYDAHVQIIPISDSP
jgi:hypothetical protein